MILNARYLPLIALLGVTAGCATSPAVLRPTGAGTVAFGGALAEAELMVGEKASGQRQDAGCGYVEFRSLPGLRCTVENGLVTRADAGPGVRNSLGGAELFLVDPDGRYAIVMEAAGSKIIAIRAGLSTSVGSPQGCP